MWCLQVHGTVLSCGVCKCMAPVFSSENCITQTTTLATVIWLSDQARRNKKPPRSMCVDLLRRAGPSHDRRLRSSFCRGRWRGHDLIPEPSTAGERLSKTGFEEVIRWTLETPPDAPPPSGGNTPSIPPPVIAADQLRNLRNYLIRLLRQVKRSRTFRYQS